MRGKVLAIAFVLMALTLVVSGAGAQNLMFELSDWPGMYSGEIIEVLPGDEEVLWIHLYDGDNPGSWWHVDESPQLWWDILPGEVMEGSVTVLEWHIQPSFDIQSSVWYPFVTIQVDGVPSTMFEIYGIIPLAGVGPEYESSMPIWKHVTPEPSSMLALGTGLFGLGGLLLRRRK